MSDVIATSPEITRVLDDYDFVFSSGMTLPVTLDHKAGDTYDDSSDFIHIRVAPQQSMSDPQKLLPPSEIKINKSHVASVQHRTREVLELTPEQRFEWEKTLQGKVQ